MEDKADQRDRRGKSKIAGAIRHGYDLAAARDFQPRREVPVGQHRIEFVLLQLGVQQRGAP